MGEANFYYFTCLNQIVLLPLFNNVASETASDSSVCIHVWQPFLTTASNNASDTASLWVVVTSMKLPTREGRAIPCSLVCVSFTTVRLVPSSLVRHRLGPRLACFISFITLVSPDFSSECFRFSCTFAQTRISLV